jgi:hypothetical protein
MKVNFKKDLIGPDGSVLAGALDNELRRLLFSLDSSEKLPLSADEKYKCHSIGKRLLEGDGEIELTVEEAVFLKKICAVGFVAGAYGQVVDLIEKIII